MSNFSICFNIRQLFDQTVFYIKNLKMYHVIEGIQLYILVALGIVNLLLYLLASFLVGFKPKLPKRLFVKMWSGFAAMILISDRFRVLEKSIYLIV